MTTQRKTAATALATMLLAAIALALSTAAGRAAPPEAAEEVSAKAPVLKDLPTAREARGQAQLLHDTLHAALQIVHHEYYREDEGLRIPAATLDKVFRAVAERRGVELRWLAVNAQAMNVDHKPRSEFEKKAVEALAGGKESYDAVDGGMYRHAGTITLTSDCLKCHSPNRTNTKELMAGLVIAIPIDQP